MQPKTRESKYCRLLRSILGRGGHWTNAQLLDELQSLYPNLSATTVHRITARLAERGEIRQAPQTHDGAVRYESRVDEHDHFMCSECDLVHDIQISRSVIDSLQEMVADCRPSGPMIIQGLCGKCQGEVHA